MYRDNTLIPSEAIRLLALGILADGARAYAQLAGEVRHFTGHIAGPSLDLVAPPIELLKVEGLIHAEPGETPESEALTITEAGREELQRLLSANLRAPINDINKLILALKLRFLHLLPQDQQALQVELLIEMSERELARLTELRGRHADDSGHLVAWLDHDIAAVTERLNWFRELEQRI